MKILLITQYFPPETGAATNRLLSFARGFAVKGHDVTVLSEFPCYPSGKVPEEYRHKLYAKERFENFKVVRTYVIPTGRKGLRSRLLNYVSFMFSSLIVGLFLRRPNVIIVSSPPPTVGASAAIISFLKMVPLIGDLRDLWPDYAIKIGELKNKYAIICGRIVERIFYWRCFAFVTISEGLKSDLEKKISSKEVRIVMNGSSIPDLPAYTNRKADCFSGPIINVCYAGVVGLLQPVQDIVDAAQITRNDKTIKYTIIGSGVKLEELKELARERGLSNIEFTGDLKFNETNELMLTADIAVVPLLDIEEFKGALPSKFFDSMALGLPVILGVDGEARQILEENRTGIYYKPGSSEDLVEKIYWLKAHPEEARYMGEAGRRLVYNSFPRSLQAERMEQIVMELMKSC
jgi:glycosyltransferase involved in cell wall biosynthesis